MGKGPNLNELNRLAPAFAQGVRYDMLFFKEVMHDVAGDASIPTHARQKLEELSGHFGNIAQRATQFIQITNTDCRIGINAKHCIRNLMSLLQRILGGHKLHIDIPDDVWPIQVVSEAQFLEILIYLVTNSSNAMRETGTLLIRARNVTESKREAGYNDNNSTPTDFVSVEVIDSGVGIPKHIIDHILEPFISVNGTPGSVTLASINFVVKQLGGRVRVDSTIGKGTVVNVLLPRFSKGRVA